MEKQDGLIKMSSKPKPFSIESIIATKQSSGENHKNSPDHASIPAGYHPMLPFPLYNPWIAGYLSQQNNGQQIIESPLNYHLIAAAQTNKERLVQYFNGSSKFNEIFADYAYADQQRVTNNPNSVNNHIELNRNATQMKEIDIESNESCHSDISLTSSPDGSTSRPQGKSSLVRSLPAEVN